MSLDELGGWDHVTEGTVVRLDWPDVTGVAREEAFRRLATLVEARDGVPADVVESARLSFQPRSVDDELAALVYDSMVDDDLLASVRSGGSSTRQLTFASRAMVLELEVPDDPSGSVMGQVVPPQAAEIELRHRGGTTALIADELGCFELSSVPAGPVSFRCRAANGSSDPVATTWITL